VADPSPVMTVVPFLSMVEAAAAGCTRAATAAPPEVRRTLHGFVAARGVSFRPPAGQLPPGLYRGVPRYCFANCHAQAKASCGRWLYCEGFALTAAVPFPVLHAWLTPAAAPGTAVDVTWETPGLEYVGLCFTPGGRRRADALVKTASLIDGWQDGWPLLRMTPAELAGVLHPALHPPPEATARESRNPDPAAPGGRDLAAGPGRPVGDDRRPARPARRPRPDR